MGQQTELAISKREVTGKASKHLRKAGMIPAHVYGQHEESLSVQVEAQAFEGLRRTHKTKGVIALRLDDGSTTQTALVRHIQFDAVTGKILHIDFFRVSMTERMTVRIPLRFVGEAAGVKSENGVLLHLMDALEVECLVSDIVDAFDVDITPLAHVDDVLHAKDVKLPENYTLITEPDEAIAKIAETRAEAAAQEETAAEAAPETPTAPAEAEA